MDKLNNVKRIPRFNYTIGMLPTSFKDSMTYQEQLTWLCNYFEATIEPSLNNTINAFNKLSSTVTETLNDYNQTLTDALTQLNLDIQQAIADMNTYVENNLTTIATSYLTEHINSGDIYLSLGMDYDSTDEELTFQIDAVPSEELIDELATLATPQREV